MLLLAIIVSSTLVGLALLQAVLAIHFARLCFRQHHRPVVVDADLPMVAILLSLRGADPYLAQGLKRLLQQRYPHYEVRIVVDRQDDTAWEVVQNVIRETGAPNVHVSLLRQRRVTCSLKNSALLQLIADLNETCEVIVLADSDLVPHREWLRELVLPLLEEGVGATFGNPWFVPTEGRWGSLLRYLWNAPAVVFRYFSEIPWAGTFAIRRSTLQSSALVDKWAHAMVDDAPARNLLHAQGLRLQCVPSLMMINREECNLAFCFNFITRQMTWARIYRVGWLETIFGTLVISGGLIVSAILVLLGLALNQFGVAAWASGGLVSYWLLMLVSLVLLEISTRRIMRARGEPTMRFSPRIWAKVVVAIPFAQCVHLAAMLVATFKRRIIWRGVTYHIRGPWNIRLVHDQPFEYASKVDHSNVSL
jgi:cellulose synthase/poly-beta-1,6-N-acetylglucosamine synthase-like glycosyltransferase